MRSVRSFASAAAAAACAFCLISPLVAGADVTAVTDTTPASSLNGCASSITFTATVNGTEGTRFYWITQYTVSGLSGNSNILTGDSATIASSGVFKLQYTLNIPPSELGSGHLQFNTQTTPQLVNFDSKGVAFNTGCVQPAAYTGVTLANVTAVPEGGACVGYLRLGGLIENDTRSAANVTYHWLYGGVSSPRQTVVIDPLGRATVKLAVSPYPRDSGTVQLVTDSPSATSNTLNYTVSAPIAHNANATRPLDPSRPPAPATPMPPIANCLS